MKIGGGVYSFETDTHYISGYLFKEGGDMDIIIDKG